MAYRVKLPPEGTPESLYTGSHIFSKPVTSVTSVTDTDKISPREDVYGQAAERALKRICARPYFPGALRWLKHFNPAAHRTLTRDLLKEIDRLWDTGATLEEFQAVLDEWVDAHAQAVKLYEGRDAASNG